jgi:phage terminase small subunit
MSLKTEIIEQCRSNTPEKIIDMIVELATIANDAKKRIDNEGTVVRTLKGDVIAHPAIKIHSDTTKNIAAIMKEYGSPKRF